MGNWVNEANRTDKTNVPNRFYHTRFGNRGNGKEFYSAHWASFRFGTQYFAPALRFIPC